jgi:hypothetical protein
MIWVEACLPANGMTPLHKAAYFFRPDETALARRAKEKSRLTLTLRQTRITGSSKTEELRS